jgi:hypothetical protein
LTRNYNFCYKFALEDGIFILKTRYLQRESRISN